MSDPEKSTVMYLKNLLSTPDLSANNIHITETLLVKVIFLWDIILGTDV